MHKFRMKKRKDIETKQDNGVDYNEYDMGIAETIFYIFLGCIVLFAVGYVFYQNIIFSILLALFGLRYPKMRKKAIIKARKNKLELQFKDMLYSLSSAIGAGNSVENALSVTLHDMLQQYNDPNAFIIKELKLMTVRIEMNQPIEAVMEDFAKRSHLEDIQTFANIFEISKRTGGNIISIIRNTTQIIADKIETRTEIETMIAGQQMEQKVLIVLPIGLVFFMTKTGGGFMEPIFTTWAGRIIATVSLGIILLGTLWSKKIADIQI